MPRMFKFLDFMDRPSLSAIDFLRPDEYERMKESNPEGFKQEMNKLVLESTNPHRIPRERETCLQILEDHGNGVIR